MKEISDLASVLRSTVADLKQASRDATIEFTSEVINAKANVSKVKAMTRELKAANKDVEAMLGQSGSNFSGQDEQPLAKQEPASPRLDVDINGVTRGS